LFGVGKTESDFGTFIHGYLVKYKDEKKQEVVLAERHELGTVTNPLPVTAKSRFFLEVSSGLIAFHTIAQKIDYNQFCGRFAELLELGHDNIFINAEIQAIQERYELLKEIGKFSRLDKIAIKLHPSNPNHSDKWVDMDNRMKDLGVDAYTESYESKKNGFKKEIESDNEITSKILMAEDGYGNASVTGIKDEKTTVITTKDNPITEEIVESEDNKDMIEQLKKKIKEIKKRFK
jgi:hypothetical protein